MVHFVSTQPGRETINRVPRSCWQQRFSVRVPLLVPTASPFSASYAVFLSVRTRALHLSLCLCLSLSSSHCDCVCSSESSPNPRPSAQRYSGVKVLFITQQHASLLSCLLQRPFFLLAEPARRTQCPAKSFVLHHTCSLLHRIGSGKAITSSQRWRA